MSWPAVPLQEVADIERSSIKPEEIATGTSYLGLEHIESGGAIIGREEVANGDLASNKFVFGPRHILYGKLRPYLAKIALPDFEGICSTDILPVLPSAKIDRSYLAHFLRQPKMVEYASSRSTGANLPRLSPKSLAEFPIPLPPLEEQRRIAGILDQADALRRLRTRALDKLNTLGQAIFHEMFGDVRNNPRGLPTQTLSQVATFTSGATPSKKNSVFWENGNIPWITPKDMKSYELHGSIDHVTQSATEQTSLKAIQIGTPLIVVRGMILAHTVPMGITRVECTINQDMKAMNFADCVLPEFGLACLLAQHDSLLSRVDTAAHGTKRFDLDRLGETIVLVPSHEDQKRLLDALHVARKAANNSTLSGTAAQGLFTSLQHRAFRGEL